jgi:hypothetical protein
VAGSLRAGRRQVFGASLVTDGLAWPLTAERTAALWLLEAIS